MPAKADPPQPEVVPTEQAVPIPPEAQAAMDAANAPAAPPHPVPARRAHFKGSVNEYPAPLLIAERDPATGAVTERILYTPARDLDDDEWQAMPKEQRDYLAKAYGHLYEIATDAQVHESRRSTTKHKGE